jgi:hypothetical protein
MGRGHSKSSLRLLCVAAAVLCTPAYALQAAHYSITPQPLKNALIAFGLQSGLGVVGASNLTDTRTSRGFLGDTPDAAIALRQVLRGTGLTFRRDGDGFVILVARTVRSGSAQAQTHQLQGGKIE